MMRNSQEALSPATEGTHIHRRREETISREANMTTPTHTNTATAVTSQRPDTSGRRDVRAAETARISHTVVAERLRWSMLEE
jgi:hypothetical protein